MTKANLLNVVLSIIVILSFKMLPAIGDFIETS